MKKGIFRKTIIFAFTVFSITLFAQNNLEKKVLKIGDDVPNLKFSNMVNYPAKEIELKNLKDKLVILDFWAKW